MSEIKSKISTIVANSYDTESENDIAIATYTIIDKNNNSKTIELRYPMYIMYTEYIRKGGIIIDTENKPAYGFKLVKNSYNQSMFMRVSDNAVIPYIFDIATNFNIYGLALVAKDGKIAWIDREFMYYDVEGTKKELCEEHRMDGWWSVSSFTGGITKLSRCIADLEQGYTSFVDTFLNIKEFRKYDGEKLSDQSMDRFSGLLTDFDKTGYARRVKNSEECQEELILSSEGYYMTEETLLKEAIRGREKSIIQTALDEGIIDTISDKVKQLKK